MFNMSPVVVSAAREFELWGVGIERFHEGVDVLDLGDGHIDSLPDRC
jgi:hypothetical protein